MSLDWQEYQRTLLHDADLNFTLDAAHSFLPADWPERHAVRLKAALQAMQALEAGAIANPSEKRRVGHYWLRAAALAPEAALGEAINACNAAVRAFATEVHTGRLRAPCGEAFSDMLCIGIGGSALGPMLVSDALGPGPGLAPAFLDNTDPDGVERVLQRLGSRLATTLVVVTSKSGSTPEPLNCTLLVRAAFAKHGLDFARQAVAVTGEGSRLDREAAGWLARFPMWDWVGGRTSLWSAVGLVPGMLEGLDMEGLLRGACEMDVLTRRSDFAKNPAALLSVYWWEQSGGRGARSLVVLPYKDRLAFFARYLQQLIMESLGKRTDSAGRDVFQGLTVYGNKGSTDQHAYVQQLRDGVHDFFALFVEVLREGRGARHEVEKDISVGDFLGGFLSGTRAALADAGRASLSITLRNLDARSLGALLALFERSVGFYASFADINAYDQPGVEAGKLAAAQVLDVQRKLLDTLRAAQSSPDVAELAASLSADAETVFSLLRRLEANGVVSSVGPAEAPWQCRWRMR
ncbi:MAG: glucose-6-phosphate isomerase [Planctomycetes bacterium]|nr:glucose-6-phosphate isomerase [Planctomycetota bacterium]